jgi:sugar-specific transcriptional regulator TrmB
MYTTATTAPRPPTRWITVAPVTAAKDPPPVGANLNLAAGLKLVGLPVRQARLYLALSRGPQTARHAAEIAGFHRATAYRVLVRLLERGLVVGDGRIPQRFEALPPEVLFARLEGFLREEADLSSLLTVSYGRWARAVPERTDGGPEPIPPRLLNREKGARDPTLTLLETTRQTLDVVVRPLSCSVGFRTSLLRTLGGLLRRGVKVRLVLDATPTDQRFLAALLREAGEGRKLLSRRHFAPLGAHYYLCDGRVAIRLPGLGFAGQVPEIALAEEDPTRLRALVRRFEALWTEASTPFGPARSTRSYAWSRAADLFQAVGEGRTVRMGGGPPPALGPVPAVAAAPPAARP